MAYAFPLLIAGPLLIAAILSIGGFAVRYLAQTFAPLADDLQDIGWTLTHDVPLHLKQAYRALGATLPVPGMSRADYNFARVLKDGEPVGRTFHGIIHVGRQQSEIALAHRAVAPNFAPSDTFVGFTATGYNGRSPQAPYWSPNKMISRPALYPSIRAAAQALRDGKTEEPDMRLFYHSDTAQALNQYLASVQTSEARDDVKDGL